MVKKTASAAQRVARLLKEAGKKVVFAESCTGGLVSGALTQIPGISEFHCGGVVVYRNATKIAYLKIPAALLKNSGPVSAAVAERMAVGVLAITPEADIAVSVTGHLGPGAPPKLDGVVYAAIAEQSKNGRPRAVVVQQFRCSANNSRAVRQRWVVEQVLSFLDDWLKHKAGPAEPEKRRG